MSGDVEINPGPVTPVNTVNELSFGCLNARSARNKAALIHDLINDSQLDILTLTETWFRPDDPPSITDDAAPDGFTIRNVIRRRPSLHHKSSPNRLSIGGGLAVIYRNDLPVSPHTPVDRLPSVSSFELQLVRIGCFNPATTLINIYRPPSTNIGVFINELSDVLAWIIMDCNDHLLLCGDLSCASADGSTYCR